MHNHEAPIPAWFDASMPTRAQCVLGPLLDHWAATTPQQLFAIFDDGVQWTWHETRLQVRNAAQALQALGIAKGDTVVVWLPNGRAMFLAWFACNYLGAVYVRSDFGRQKSLDPRPQSRRQAASRRRLSLH